MYMYYACMFHKIYIYIYIYIYIFVHNVTYSRLVQDTEIYLFFSFYLLMRLRLVCSGRLEPAEELAPAAAPEIATEKQPETLNCRPCRHFYHKLYTSSHGLFPQALSPGR